MNYPLYDIHCHIVPGIDDGAEDLQESLAMARMAVEDGIHTIIATPHQAGNFSENRGQTIRERVAKLQRELQDNDIPLNVLPGADVRIEDNTLAGLLDGDIVSLGDHRQHVLLELPHELYMPLEPVLEGLSKHDMTGILSHPERNHGILREPELLGPLVDSGCLMQVTAGSLCGTFGDRSQQLAEQMIRDGLVHFLATDAHGVRSRRPLLSRALERVIELTDEATAIALCSDNPRLVAEGGEVPAGRRIVRAKKRNWLGFRKVAS